MGLNSDQWEHILSNEHLRSYFRVDNASHEVYFIGYLAAQFKGDECVHISVAVGDADNIDILYEQTQHDRPTVHNATREIGRFLANALNTEIRQKLKVDPSAFVCLSRLTPGIPHGDAKEDKGLHMSLFNKSPGGSAPSAADVKELQLKFRKGIALQLDLSDLKVVKGARCNDMSTGGLYYLACGMSENLAKLCKMVQGRFPDAIKGFAAHVSLELWGVAGCRHTQQKLGEGSDVKHWYCDYLRWGMRAGAFGTCLDAHGNFDLARYMYVHTQETFDGFSEAEKDKVGDTLALMNNFSLGAIDEFVAMADAYSGFGSIDPKQRLHDRDSAVYKFFANAPVHPGVDCPQARIRNCAAAAGKCPRWFAGQEFSLPTAEVQVQLAKYIAASA
jgi:hypothetical protein